MLRLVLDSDDSVSTPMSLMYMRRKGLPWLTAAFGILSFVLIIALFALIMRDPSKKATPLEDSENCKELGNVSMAVKKLSWQPPSVASSLVRFKNAAVTSDNSVCSEIGRDVLLRGGNAADAAIAVLICIGALNPYSSGLGGGFLLTLYKRKEKKCVTVNAREAIPILAKMSWFEANPSDAVVGYKSIATPGELHGLWTTFKRFGSGRIAWQDLIMPTVKLLSAGYPVSALLEQLLEHKREPILNESSMMHAFMNPSTNHLYKEGELLRNTVLANTLRQLATSPEPHKLFYHGEIARQISNEMIEYGAFVTKVDLAAYEASVDESPLINDHFWGSLAICGPAPPSSFAITQLIVTLIAKWYNSSSDSKVLYESDEFYHHFLEAQKLAFAQTIKLGDGSSVPEVHLLAVNMTSPFYVQQLLQHIDGNAKNSVHYSDDYSLDERDGTSHISIVDTYGRFPRTGLLIGVDRVGSLEGLWQNGPSHQRTEGGFGSMRRSEKLGIVWNDDMRHFFIPLARSPEVPTSKQENQKQSQKRSLTSISPTVVFDKSTGEVQMVIGAAGDSKVMSAIGYVIARCVIFNETIKQAIDSPRLHAHLSSFSSSYNEHEPGFPSELIAMLEQRGYKLVKTKFPFSVVHAVLRDSSRYLTVCNDYRRQTHMHPAGF
ncbi:unnamed protein product [Toxocara canis]|uniref:Gamma-glutamyltranspeptidase 1 n=1 Tax=Toxocara canis TaxID=6265 RepID=A0A183ULD1_TOXCA|nr:unnamed protein product [Toxocara canis]